MNEIVLEDDATFTAPTAAKRIDWSPQQLAIFDAMVNGTGDILVGAVAGSGKTTLLEGCCKRVPSGASAIYCAFSSTIVKASRDRFAPAECKTIHSLGRETVCKYLDIRYLDMDKSENKFKYRNLVRKESWKLAERMPAVNRQELTSALGDLVDYCQSTLALLKDTNALQAVLSVVRHFGLALPCPAPEIVPSVIFVLRAGIQQAEDERIISFSDMLYLPAVWGLRPSGYDFVFNDEVQDYSAAQLDLVLKMRAPGGRMVFVGDRNQAIMGFAGADASSYDDIKVKTNAVELPLSVSYRCPVLVVREAQAIVPGIQPRPGAPLGTVRWISETELYANVKEGDLLLCRMTAPLIATCLDLIRQKVPARVRGKDIGKMLVKTVQTVIDRRDFWQFADFPKHLREYTQEQTDKLARQQDQESMIERAYDIESALLACFQGLDAHDAQDFCEAIQRLFSDDRPGVWLSTVHKAKGLEASRVFILRPDKLPMVWRGQQPWEHEQEMNLRYVAITRSLDELVYVRQAGEQL